MTEEPRLHPVRDLKDGDTVIFNAELLRAKRFYTMIYLTDYFAAADPDAHTTYTVHTDDRTLSIWDDYSKPTEIKRQLYDSYCESATVLPREATHEDILAAHKDILAARIQQHHEQAMSTSALLANEKENKAKIKDAIARTMRSISRRIYDSASKGRTFVDVDFNTITVKPVGFCSDGRRRDTPDGYAAFVLLGSSADEMPHEALLDHIHQQLLERFPHLSISVKKQGLLFPVMRITFAEVRDELSLC